MELAGNIYRLRTARGMSQEELADRARRFAPVCFKVGRRVRRRRSSTRWRPSPRSLASRWTSWCSGRRGPLRKRPQRATVKAVGAVRRRKGRYIAAVALLCTGAALAVVLFLLGAGLIWPVIFTSPLWLCGLVCLRARRHVGFWCCVAAYLPVLWYIKWGTGVSYGDLFFWAPYNNPMRGIIYIVFVVCNVGLIIFGIRSFRDAELRSRRPWLRVALCAALYVAAYFLRTRLHAAGRPGRAGPARQGARGGVRCGPVCAAGRHAHLWLRGVQADEAKRRGGKWIRQVNLSIDSGAEICSNIAKGDMRTAMDDGPGNSTGNSIRL